MLLVGKVPRFGKYVEMFIAVLITFANFFVAYLFLFVGFTVSFYILFPQHAEFKQYLPPAFVKILVTNCCYGNHFKWQNSA